MRTQLTVLGVGVAGSALGALAYVAASGPAAAGPESPDLAPTASAAAVAPVLDAAAAAACPPPATLDGTQCTTIVRVTAPAAPAPAQGDVGSSVAARVDDRGGERDDDADDDGDDRDDRDDRDDSDSDDDDRDSDDD